MFTTHINSYLYTYTRLYAHTPIRVQQLPLHYTFICYNYIYSLIPHSYPYLDAKITGWNMRDKKIATSKM